MSEIRELYISTDGETDGPIPVDYSLVSFGAFAACVKSDAGIEALSKTDKTNTFYAELKPISEQWDPEALAISGLSREHLLANGEDPTEAMTRFVDWVKQMKVKHNATQVIFTGYPLGFDWMFIYWYLIHFAKESPFGFSKHIDMKSYYSGKTNEYISRSVKARMPKYLMSKHPHTHNPVDDAIEQGELHTNMLRWDGKNPLKEA
jgi:hypothetical protein